MSCNHCRDTFSRADAPALEYPRATFIDLEQPSCHCETFSVSEFSPGVVKCDERVLRLLVAPQHMNRKNQPKPGALTDAEVNGLSVFRESASDSEILLSATSLVTRARLRNNEKAGVFGVLNMDCTSIRRFQYDSEAMTCYCVYDTALRESKYHAEVFQKVADASLGLRESRRNSFFLAIQSNFIPVSDFRNGFLDHLKPKA